MNSLADFWEASAPLWSKWVSAPHFHHPVDSSNSRSLQGKSTWKFFEMVPSPTQPSRDIMWYLVFQWLPLHMCNQARCEQDLHIIPTSCWKSISTQVTQNDIRSQSFISACNRIQLLGRWFFSRWSIHLARSNAVWQLFLRRGGKHRKPYRRAIDMRSQDFERRTVFLKWDSVMPARLSMSISEVAPGLVSRWAHIVSEFWFVRNSIWACWITSLC